MTFLWSLGKGALEVFLGQATLQESAKLMYVGRIALIVLSVFLALLSVLILLTSVWVALLIVAWFG